MAVSLIRHRFTVDEYHTMLEAGILSEDDRVELIEGEIVDMTPIGRRHLACVDRLNDLFTHGLGNQAIVRVQGSLRLLQHSEPEPDIVLLRRRPDFYATVDAGPADTLLIVEVADTSLQYDREVKLPLYAKAGIPEVWLVDLDGATVTVCREPAPDGYRSIVPLKDDDRLTPQAFPTVTLTPKQILG